MSFSVTEYRNEINAVNQEIKDKKSYLKDVYDNLIREHCPVKIGDEVEVNSGYFYMGLKMIVESISARVPNDNSIEFICRGTPLNNNSLAVSKHSCKITGEKS